MTERETIYYKRLRHAGYTARDAIRAARIVKRFEDLEGGGRVRLRLEPEVESYFDVYGEPEGYTDIHGRRHSAEEEHQEICGMIDLHGLWFVVAEVRCPCCGAWEWADSIGMCIYRDPLDFCENAYVPDLMAAAIGKAEELTA